MGIAGHQREELLTAAGADAVLQDFIDLTLAQFHSLVGMQVAAAARARSDPVPAICILSRFTWVAVSH